MYAKISSPSRPASHALMTRSTSSRLSSLWIAFSCLRAFASRASSFDPWPLGLPLWPRRQLRFMAKSELFNPLLAPILRAFGAFKVRRGEGDLEAIRTAVDLVRSGEVVV